MYSHEFLLCCCSYLNDEREKQTHLCRTIELSDYRVVGLYIANGLSDYSYMYVPKIDLSPLIIVTERSCNGWGFQKVTDNNFAYQCRMIARTEDIYLLFKTNNKH